MGYEIQESGSDRILCLNGKWTIENARRLKTILMELMSGSERVVLSLEKATEVDLSCLQLICSAHRTSLSTNKALSLDPQHPEAFKRLVRDAGYPRALGCHGDPGKSCLWLGGWEP
jgi:hypothetical protein